MNLALYKRVDGRWLEAPWNDGEGGDFTALQGEQLEWFVEVLQDSGITDADGVFLLGQLDDGLPIEVHALDEATKRRQDKIVKVTSSEGISATIEGFADSWIDSLVGAKDVPLAVANLGTEAVLVWLNDGGKSKWEGTRNRADADRALKLEQARLARKRESENFFINPYSFAPPPPSVHRGTPRGHDRLGPEGVSGWFDWVLTLRTDLLLAQDQPALDNEVLDYPGSSLRGALRSLHESISGGCMRALDDSYVPVHRDPMNVYRNASYRLAVVREVDEMTHAVTKVEVANQVHWVEHSVLRAGLTGDLYSGRTLSLNTSAAKWESAKGRHEVTASGTVSAGGDWAMHITASGARALGHPYFVAVGRLSGTEVSVNERQWTNFVSACEGGKDLTGVTSVTDTSGSAPNAPGWPGIDVSYDGTSIGKRRKSDGWLGVGDTVWLSDADQLKMAVIWRTQGRHPVSDRMDKDLIACADPASLCPSCAVFGSIRAERTDDHEQPGYRSHINVGWAVSAAPGAEDGSHLSSAPRTLPPLRSPKPSSGGFYLEAPADNFRTASKDKNHIPRFHWRDQPNQEGELRRIRGRKFYWHGQTPGGRQTPRDHNTRQHGNTQAVAAGTTLRARITFDNLNVEQLGWLLAAAQPSLLFGTECLVHIGGGKPLGYGSAAPKVENLQLFNAATRYGSGRTEITADDAMEHIRGLIDERGLEPTHAALKRLLAEDAVHADRISYPTTKSFNLQGTKAFDESFNWFGKHSGGREGALVPLPEAADRDQYLDSRENQ